MTNLNFFSSRIYAATSSSHVHFSGAFGTSKSNIYQALSLLVTRGHLAKLESNPYGQNNLWTKFNGQFNLAKRWSPVFWIGRAIEKTLRGYDIFVHSLRLDSYNQWSNRPRRSGDGVQPYMCVSIYSFLWYVETQCLDRNPHDRWLQTSQRQSGRWCNVPSAPQGSHGLSGFFSIHLEIVPTTYYKIYIQSRTECHVLLLLCI
jgi:hypothetical protein